MNPGNALQTFRGQLREPMAQINFGLEDDLFSTQVDPLLGKHDFDSLTKPHHALMDNLHADAALSLNLKSFETDLSRQLHIVPGQADYAKVHQQHPMVGNYTKENDSNLAPAYRQFDNLNDRPDN